jgi:hypothetical protein
MCLLISVIKPLAHAAPAVSDSNRRSLRKSPLQSSDVARGHAVIGAAYKPNSIATPISPPWVTAYRDDPVELSDVAISSRPQLLMHSDRAQQTHAPFARSPLLVPRRLLGAANREKSSAAADRNRHRCAVRAWVGSHAVAPGRRTQCEDMREGKGVACPSPRVGNAIVDCRRRRAMLQVVASRTKSK